MLDSNQLLTVTDHGIFCSRAGIYIDPWGPVGRAVITHAHSDHARPGVGSYLAHPLTAAVMRYRLGAEISVQEIQYGEAVTCNGVAISLHPAGHVPGSAQIRVEHAGEVWVVTGDYKLENDGLSDPFEPVTCHTFITECTFGLPVFRWESQSKVGQDLQGWITENEARSVASVIYCYSLGKAQRTARMIGRRDSPLVMHGSVRATTSVLRNAGLLIDEGVTPEDFKASFPGRTPIVLAPQSAQNSSWLKRFRPYSTARMSGWMAIQGIKRRSGVDRGFVLSDHADFENLLIAIRETGASNIFTTHGYTSQFARYLREIGYNSKELPTHFGDSASLTEE